MATNTQQLPSRDEMFNQRLPFILIGMVVISALLILKLISFQQLSPDVVNELSPDYNRTVKLASARGFIFDHSGQRLAVNTVEYRIGISPNLVANPQRSATQLAAILNLDELEVYKALTSDSMYVLLAPRVSAEQGQAVEKLKEEGLTALQIEKIPRRNYPQGTVAAQILGFVGGDLQGYYGVEGKFQDQLVGRPRTEIVSNIPFDLPPQQEADKGSDIYLTIDRDVQFLIESELAYSIDSTGAKSGTIIVMNPRTGDLLGMASYPSYDPNNFQAETDPNIWRNPAISNAYEPGSVMKVVTVAAALENKTITPGWTYNDQGMLDMAGIQVQNWDREAHGIVDTTGILVQSLNVGAANVSLAMGPTDFYKFMSKFGFGRLTGINLEGEAGGTLHVPGDSVWSESNLLTNSYGQGVAVTPLQMITAVSAIANDGLMMQPNVVAKIVTNGEVNISQPIALSHPISTETAHIVRDMMVSVVQNGLDDAASLPGYTIAGKTGTAEIPGPVRYRSDAWIMSFIGFFPADDPQAIVLIKLDEPSSGRWASQVVAPIFRRLAERLVVIMEIPNDATRKALEAQGAIVGETNQ
ncbi:MAG: penicillin-binding protein 2 [Chloroflexi bacterium]|nr:penicillin-binding protein 2 [Chloroflexota bacterium]MCC6896680.1 penicillin-binding protein 2 [Anaerolineae bacterium]